MTTTAPLRRPRRPRLGARGRVGPRGHRVHRLRRRAGAGRGGRGRAPREAGAQRAPDPRRRALRGLRPPDPRPARRGHRRRVERGRPAPRPRAPRRGDHRGRAPAPRAAGVVPRPPAARHPRRRGRPERGGVADAAPPRGRRRCRREPAGRLRAARAGGAGEHAAGRRRARGGRRVRPRRRHLAAARARLGHPLDAHEPARGPARDDVAADHGVARSDDRRRAGRARGDAGGARGRHPPARGSPCWWSCRWPGSRSRAPGHVVTHPDATASTELLVGHLLADEALGWRRA